MKNPDIRQSTLENAVVSVVGSSGNLAGSPPLAVVSRAIINAEGAVVLDASKAKNAGDLLSSSPVPRLTRIAPDGSVWEETVTNDGQLERRKL